MTSLGAADVGDPVNLEMDMIAKYVERLMERSAMMNEHVHDAETERSSFSTIEEALADLRAGKIILVVDDADRENEGDFIIAAEKCTPEAVNFMVTHGRGIVCLPVAAWRLDELQIPQMVSSNGGDDTAFTVSIDYRPAITTGTSAHDRAFTAAAIADASVGPRDFHRPGHVFPLRAKEGGVLRRAGHTEAAVDLASLAGLFPAGVICEVMNEDGTMARLPELVRVAEEFDLKLISIADLIEYRRHKEVLVARVAEAAIPTAWGDFRAYAFDSTVDGRTHVALVYGEIGDGEKVLTRVHSECLTGDVFGSLRCDCGRQLEAALEKVGRGGPRCGPVHARARGPRDRPDATNCAPTSSRIRVGTPWRPISSSASRRTSATTASELRSWWSSASRRCVC